MSKNKTKSRKGSVLILIGELLLIAALGLGIYNVMEAHKAGQASGSIIEGLGDDDALTPPWYSDREMPVRNIDGVDYIGMLTIPELGLQLPVAMDWSYEQLMISPARFRGNYFRNDMVVCAHNFMTHFGKLISCDLGIDVYFQSVEGYVYKYKISDRKTIQPENLLEMVINRGNFERYVESDLGQSDGGNESVVNERTGETIMFNETEDWDLTLYTCNWGGRSRCAIRCTRVKE